MPAPLARRALFAVLIALLSMSAVPTAQAHTEVISTEPADGAQLKKAPAQVTLTFAEPPLDTGLAVVAQGPDGQADLPTEVKGNTVIASWPLGTPGGQYRVSYRVVAADGHPITGQLGFSVAGSEAPKTPSASTPAEPSPSTSASAAAAEAEPPSSGPAIPYWLWVLGAVLIVAAGYVLIARGRRPDDS
jgi:methionine-rich copper-binding protein CopC